MQLSKTRLRALKSAFERGTGVDWNSLISGSTEVILFGSWAVEGETPRSDIDLLCVDFSRRIKSASVDVINYPSEFLLSESWLTSELGVHVAHYGIWLKGEGAWRRKARITPSTVAKKKEQILIRAIRLTGSLTTSTSSLRAREMQKLRRDLQRFAFLVKKQATPPAALLDRQWEEQPSVKVQCADLLRDALASTVNSASDLMKRLA